MSQKLCWVCLGYVQAHTRVASTPQNVLAICSDTSSFCIPACAFATTRRQEGDGVFVALRGHVHASKRMHDSWHYESNGDGW
eukprot:m.1490223 g.1490223  ORF g.1490223 m.1490223 type:complete len:82 (+) comp25190_c0_seq55:1392-1637(+)